MNPAMEQLKSLGKRSEQAKELTDVELAQELYEVVLTGEIRPMILCEAAQRLGVERLTTKDN